MLNPHSRRQRAPALVAIILAAWVPSLAQAEVVHEDMKIVGPYPDDSYAFAQSASLDGDTLAIGQTDYYNSDGDAVGAAYLYYREPQTGGWSLERLLVPAEGVEFDWFGRQLALSGDTLAVGAPGDEADNPEPASSEGAVYIYERLQPRPVEEPGPIENLLCTLPLPRCQPVPDTARSLGPGGQDRAAICQ
jgi:hypothetical protein